jgi:CheY-like chemotaxis protein
MTRTAVATDDHGHVVRRVVHVGPPDDGVDLLRIVLDGLDEVTFHESADGEHALELCREHRADVLLLDIAPLVMPAADVVRAVREDPALVDLRVILLVDRARAHEVEELVAAGAETYVIKPCGPHELVAALQGRPYDA